MSSRYECDCLSVFLAGKECTKKNVLKKYTPPSAMSDCCSVKEGCNCTPRKIKNLCAAAASGALAVNRANCVCQGGGGVGGGGV